jgi:hypothetical protein
MRQWPESTSRWHGWWASARAAPLLLELLRAIRDLGSIQRASAALGISYRNGWGLLESWSTELCRPLIDKTRGRGRDLPSSANCCCAATTRSAPRWTRIARNCASASIAGSGLRPTVPDD